MGKEAIAEILSKKMFFCQPKLYGDRTVVSMIRTIKLSMMFSRSSSGLNEVFIGIFGLI